MTTGASNSKSKDAYKGTDSSKAINSLQGGQLEQGHQSGMTAAAMSTAAVGKSATKEKPATCSSDNAKDTEAEMLGKREKDNKEQKLSFCI